MIPANGNRIQEQFRIVDQPSKTYRMDLVNDRISGTIDSHEAMEQAIYKILNTERYRYLIYSWNYGSELQELFGMPVTYVCPELERRITEALTWDKRITEVTDFSFDTSIAGTVKAFFTAHTVFGDVKAQKEVKL